MNIYGDPSTLVVAADRDVNTVLSFLNTSKYPPSLSISC